MSDVETALTLPHPFVDSSNKDDDSVKTSDEKKTENKEGEVEKRRTLEEILAAAEEEFELMDTACDAAVKSLKSGKEIQRLSAIRNLTDLLDNEENYNDIITRILPALQEILVQEPSNIDIHCESAVLFKNIIRDTKYTQRFCGLTDKLLDYILRNLDNQKENVTAAAWLESLVEIADSIPIESVVELIVPLAVSQAESIRRVQRRVISSRLVEKLATIIPAEFVRRDLVPCAQMLCQDPSPAVRTTIAQRLATICQSLNNSTACVSTLLPCIVELCKDDDTGVREAILNAIATILPHFTKDSCKNTIVPLLRKCTDQSLILRDVSLSVVARQLGPWLHALDDVLRPAERQWFLDSYRRLCEMSWRESDAAARNMNSSAILYITCRRMCAYNFPCFAMVYGESHFNDMLMPLLQRFCKDSDDEVRSTIASSFHEIVKMRTASEQSALMAPFVELLCNGTAEVVQHLTGNLDRILPTLYAGFDSKSAAADSSSSKGKRQPSTLSTNAQRRGSSGSNAVATSACDATTIANTLTEPITRINLDRILIGCNRLIRGTGSWRSHEYYLRNIAVMRRLIPIHDLYSSFVPMLQQEVLTVRALPCRIAAARTLLLIMREFATSQRRASIINFFVKEIGNHTSCHRRRILLDVVPVVLEHFSRDFFIREFMPAVLALANDTVSNIRLQLCRTLTHVKTYLSFPANESQISQMERVVRDLLAGETNTHTRQLIQEFAVALSRAETDNGERTRENRVKLAEEYRLWTEHEPPPSPTKIDDTSEITLPLRDAKANVLRRSATANLVDLPVLSEKAAKLAASITNLDDDCATTSTTTLETPERTRPPRPPPSTTRQSSGSALPPSTWRTSRPNKPKMAIVRPQPQITITQRSPSPMPFGNASEKKDTTPVPAGEDRRSKLPLSTSRYRPTAADGKLEHSRKNSLTDKSPSAASPANASTTTTCVDSPLKKYRPKADTSLSRRSSAGTSIKQTTTSLYSRRSSGASSDQEGSDGYEVMIRSASSALDNGAGSASGSRNAGTTYTSSERSSSSVRRPYGLMKVQSTSAVERKPTHMSIRVISMS